MAVSISGARGLCPLRLGSDELNNPPWTILMLAAVQPEVGDKRHCGV